MDQCSDRWYITESLMLNHTDNFRLTFLLKISSQLLSAHTSSCLFYMNQLIPDVHQLRILLLYGVNQEVHQRQLIVHRFCVSQLKQHWFNKVIHFIETFKNTYQVSMTKLREQWSQYAHLCEETELKSNRLSVPGARVHVVSEEKN